MISNYINTDIKSGIKTGLVVSILAVLSACSSSSSSTSDATRVEISAAPLPANAATMPAGAKTFTNDLNDSITINTAYLVISSVTIETECDASFSAALDGLLNLIIPAAHAHTESTPTSTGAPHVIDLLAVDGGDIEIGELSPPTGDFCGADIDMLAADADAENLPAGAGDPDMIGKTVYVEGTYDVGALPFTISSGVTLINRELLLSALMIIDKDDSEGTIDLAINYDTWFDAVDMAMLAAGDAGELNAVLQNVTNSIHQR